MKRFKLFRWEVMRVVYSVLPFPKILANHMDKLDEMVKLYKELNPNY